MQQAVHEPSDTAWSNGSEVDLTHRSRILTLQHNYDALRT